MLATGGAGDARLRLEGTPLAQWSDRRAAGAIGAASALLAVAGSWIPSLWGDEAASIMSARRDWGSLWAMLGEVDAVHGLYYALLHVWIDLAGASPFAARLPSGLAVGAASAGLYLLVRRRTTRRTAVIAAIVFAVLPRVTFLAVEARSMALATAAIVWLTLLVLRLLEAPARRAWWWVYAVGLAIAVHLFVYVVLLVPVHALVVAFESRRAMLRGIRMRSFLLAWAGAALLSAPLGLVALEQRDQVDFRRPWRVVTFDAVFVDQWFMLEWLAVVAWAFIVMAAAVALVARRREADQPGDRILLLLGAAWLIVPTAAVVVVAAIASLGYTPRYLAFCAPGAAILIAMAASSLSARWMRVVSILVIAALAVPAYLDQRSPFWKNDGTDWQAVSRVVSEVAEPGDGIVFDESVRPSRRPRLALHVYPDGFSGLVDLELVTPYDETNGLWDVTEPLAELDARLERVDRVVVVSRSRNGVDDDVAVLRRAGFEPAERVELVSSVVTVHERAPAPWPAASPRATGFHRHADCGRILGSSDSSAKGRLEWCRTCGSRGTARASETSPHPGRSPSGSR